MATIKDVASRAGVSISTVSHVLNHTRRVSEDATQKCLRRWQNSTTRPTR